MKKILIVDDSGFSRNTVKRALGDGYVFCEAENGALGLQRYDEEKPDLVILDLTMPGMTGLEVLEKLKEMDASARVIVNSADIQDFNRSRAMELGALHFVNKPVQPDILRGLVAGALKPEGEAQ